MAAMVVDLSISLSMSEFDSHFNVQPYPKAEIDPCDDQASTDFIRLSKFGVGKYLHDKPGCTENVENEVCTHKPYIAFEVIETEEHPETYTEI